MSNNAASGDFWKTAVHLPPTENNGQPKTEDVADEGTYASGSGSGEPFDPHTLAGIAALSRIVQDGAFDENVEGEDADADYSEFHPGRVTREQIQHFVDGLGTRDPVNEKDAGDDKDAANDGSEAQDEKEEADGREMNGVEEVQGDEKNSDDETRSGEDDGELSDPKYVIKGGRLKRRRNRTTLLVDDVPINYELGLRVQALESLIRSGSNMDAEAASSAAMDTVLHATRAANWGSQDANHALSSLTLSGVESMTPDAQSSLLLDVLQQLSAASTGHPTGDAMQLRAESDGQDIWTSVIAAPQSSSALIDSLYALDPHPDKINLSLQGFREDNGRIFLPPTVRHVEKGMRSANILAQEALPVEGFAPFLDSGLKFAYGEDSRAYRDRRISAIQAFSLTGALRLAANFLVRCSAITTSKAVYVPSPTREEDAAVLREAGLDVRPFSYLDRKNGGVDFEGVREDLQAAPPRSVVLLQVSGSMPTGIDFSTHQWRLLTIILQERQLIPLVVMAFQGLSSGDAHRDAQPFRYMVHEGLPVVLIQSFDAMMGIYSDSPAILSVAAHSTETKERIDSQLRAAAAGMYLHPSPWGAHVVHALLSDPKLFTAWLAEIKAMSDRLRSVREKLYDVVANKLKTPGSWLHIKRSTGMYCSTLFSASQVEAMSSKRHVYLLPEGCFALGCLNAARIDILARAIDHVVREDVREAEEQAAQNQSMELALKAAKELQARNDAAAAAAEALEEDTLLMERSIASAMEAQKRAEEDDRVREEDMGFLEESLRKATERAEVARRAEVILATMQAIR